MSDNTTTTEEADAAYWQGRQVGILVGAAQATADAEEERLALVARAERVRALVRLLVDSGDMTPMGARQVGLVLDEMTEDA